MPSGVVMCPQPANCYTKSMHRIATETKRLMAHNAHFVARNKMREDHAGSVVTKRRLHHFARVHARLRQSAAKQLFAPKQPVLRIK